MKKTFISVLSIVLSFALLLCACTDSAQSTDGGDEYTLELEDGCRQLTIYYKRDEGYENCDIWIWYDGVDGRGYIFHECSYGAKVVLNVPAEIEEVGFIIRTNCSDPGGTSWGTASKDGSESDRFVSLEGDYTVIYTRAGDANSYTSTDGGESLDINAEIALADMVDKTHIKITLSDGLAISSANVSVTDASGNAVGISSVSGNTVTTSSALDISKHYNVTVRDYGEAAVVPHTYFSSDAFNDEYYYDGDLGVKLSENATCFRLWAPTASAVKLNLYDDGSNGRAYKTVGLSKGEKGVWEYTYNENLDGKYYTYTVTTSEGVNEAVDPYAVSAGLNGVRGMILDLDGADPDGWVETPFDNPCVENYTDAEIWEVQVRDFSTGISSSKYKGKYLAFTERGLTNSNGISVGVDYLVQLGITHVHLQPTYDFASVDESKNTDGDESNDEYNWGYDPLNYNVPEGSYATDAADGSVRVKEFKQMVQALHDAGISVVLDMVFNHTYSLDSNLNKIVPYYYYRYTSEGAVSNGSGCGNETASERAMMRKYMVDSVTYWQTEYNVDGFRFDLMGLHDIKTMQEIEDAVHDINPEAIIYGEGWTGGTSTSAYTGATLANIKKVNSVTQTNGIAMFNDVIRDGIKGSVFDISDVGFATGADTSDTNSILLGVNGSVFLKGFSTLAGSWNGYNPTNVINYCSAHDNNTLWDRICYVYGTGEGTLADRLARNRLSAAIVQTCLGIPFMLAGEEMLRSKVDGDGNYVSDSYNSPDYVNSIKWEELSADSDGYAVMLYYKGLIAFRKATPALRQTVTADGTNNVCSMLSNDKTFLVFTMTDLDSDEKLLVVYNASPNEVAYDLPEGNWDLYIDGERAGDTVLQRCSSEQTFAPISCYVFKAA